MNSKKILFITANTAYGGVTFYTKTLVEYAVSKGFDLTYETGQKEVMDEFRGINVKFYTIPQLGRSINPFKDIAAFFTLYKFIKRENFDIVHTHTSKGGFLGRLAAWMAHTPTIIHSVQGFAFHEFSGKLETFFYSSLERLASKFCHKIIFVNSDDLEMALKHKVVNKEKTVIINNGVDRSKVAPRDDEDKDRMRREIIEEFNLTDDNILIGSIARLFPQKGIEYFIDAFSLVHNRFQNARLFLVGDGPLRQELEAQVEKLGIGNKVVFAGTRSDNKRVLNALDIYVLPSLWEGFSLSLMEAMSLAKPVIGTDIKGTREQLNNDFGRLVQPRSPEELANALEEYLRNPEVAKELGQKALDRFEERHSHTQMVEKTIALYN